MAELDVRPRVLVHHVLGDYVMDPWVPGATDLTRYGVIGYELTFGRPEIPEGEDVSAGALRLGVNTLAVLLGLGVVLWSQRRTR